MTNLQFEIDQLRKDKIIYAIESCAISIGSMLLLLLSSIFGLRFPVLATASLVMALFALAYLLYMGMGNMQRLKKIKTLEKRL